MSSPSPQPEVVSGHKIRKGEFVGVGAAIQAVGFLLCFVSFISIHFAGIFSLFGFLAGLVLLLVGGRKAFRLICSSCGNKLTGKEVKICPVCHCHFEK